MSCPASFCFAALLLAASISAQQVPRYPTGPEVDELLRSEPMTDASWPAWRERLLDWIGDPSRNVDPAYDAARYFLKSHASADGKVPAAYADDFLAWYLLSGAYLYAILKRDPPDPDRVALRRAEVALRRSLALNSSFPRAHRNLARIYLLKARWQSPRTGEYVRQAAAYLARARQLDPLLDLTAEDRQLTRALPARGATDRSWLAKLCGTAVGVTAFFAVRAVWQRSRGTSRGGQKGACEPRAR